MSAKRHQSRYEYSLLVIRAALAPVPMTASRRYCEGLLRPLYPFGERRRYPYKAWRRAVRRSLADRARWARWVEWPEQVRDTPLFQEAM